MTKKATPKTRARNKRLQKKRQRRSQRPPRRPENIFEVEVGPRRYDVLLTDAEVAAFKMFADSTLGDAGEVLGGQPEFEGKHADKSKRAFQGIAKKGLIRVDGDPSEGYWALTQVGESVARHLLAEAQPDTLPPTAILIEQGIA